ncbi:MAG TPA: hypothetical protein V6C81_16435 [Planktothrix sp.]|jgi:tetratricopeptide (TPR) repeat protein
MNKTSPKPNRSSAQNSISCPTCGLVVPSSYDTCVSCETPLYGGGAAPKHGKKGLFGWFKKSNEPFDTYQDDHYEEEDEEPAQPVRQAHKAPVARQQERPLHKPVPEPAQPAPTQRKESTPAKQAPAAGTHQAPPDAAQREQHARFKAEEAAAREQDAIARAHQAAYREKEAVRKAQEANTKEQAALAAAWEAAAKGQEALKASREAQQREQAAFERGQQAEAAQEQAVRKAQQAAAGEQEAIRKAQEAAAREQEAVKTAQVAAAREQEAVRKAQESAAREQELVKKAQEAIAQQQAELKLAQEETARREQEVARQAEEAKRVQAEAAKKEQEVARRAEEAQKIQVETARKEQEIAAQAMAAKKIQEEAARREQDAKHGQEEALKQAQEATRREQEAAQKLLQQEEAQRQQEVALKQAHETSRRQHEEALKQAQETARREQDVALKQAQETARREQDVALKQAQEAARLEHEEALRQAQETARREQEVALKQQQEILRREQEQEGTRRQKEADVKQQQQEAMFKFAQQEHVMRKNDDLAQKARLHETSRKEQEDARARKAAARIEQDVVLRREEALRQERHAQKEDFARRAPAPAASVFDHHHSGRKAPDAVTVLDPVETISARTAQTDWGDGIGAVEPDVLEPEVPFAEEEASSDDTDGRKRKFALLSFTPGNHKVKLKVLVPVAVATLSAGATFFFLTRAGDGGNLYSQGLEDLSRRRYASAVKLLEQATASSPKDPKISVALAQAYLGIDQVDKAWECVSRAQQEGMGLASAPQLASDLANYYRARSQFAKAVDLLRPLAQANVEGKKGELSDLDALYGDQLMLDGKLEEALRCWEEVKELNDGSRAGEAPARLATIYRKLAINLASDKSGKSDEQALAYLGKLAESSNPADLQLAADLYEKSGKPDDAIQQLQQAYKIDASDSMLKRRLIRMLKDRGNQLVADGKTEDGNNYLQQAKELQPSSDADKKVADTTGDDNGGDPHKQLSMKEEQTPESNAEKEAAQGGDDTTPMRLVAPQGSQGEAPSPGSTEAPAAAPKAQTAPASQSAPTASSAAPTQMMTMPAGQ